MKHPWTFETLAATDKFTSEQVLSHGTMPDLNKLNGLCFCGYNRGFIGKLIAEKFKRGFFEHKGIQYGYDQEAKQDDFKFKGLWLTKRIGKIGYFTVRPLKAETGTFKPYQHLVLFDHQIEGAKNKHGYFKFFRDVITLPNPGDHSLLLGKTYLALSKRLNIFCGYFILGYPQPNSYAPVSTLKSFIYKTA